MKSVSITNRSNEGTSPSRNGWLSKTISATALAIACTLTACDNNYTLAYVYAPSASLSSGLINAYRLDNQTGQLFLLPDSPVPSGGRKPVAVVATPGDEEVPAIFVIHHDDSNLVSFLIGTDGKLYPQATLDTGSFPTSIAISPDGKFLYVAFTYQSGYTTASPGPGGISVFPIITDTTARTRTLGPRTDFPIGRNPVGITVGNGGNTVYVVTQDPSAVNTATTSTADRTLNLFAFAADGSGGLTAVPGQQIVSGNAPSSGFPTGTLPASVISDPAGTHIYVSDATGNIVIAYSTAPSGIPSLIAGGTALTGSQPGGMSLSPTGQYLFVANYDGTVGEYSIGSNGAPIISTVAASTQAGTGTTCVTVEPSKGIYLYATGSLSNTLVGEQIITGTGALKPIVHSPYEAAALPLCAVSVPRFRLGS
jgi:6-phosphogluconolactonase